MELPILLVAIGLVMTILAMVLGVASMAHGGTFDEKYSTHFMFARVASQGLTVVVLLIALIIVAG
jgi:hypothetical protein